MTIFTDAERDYLHTQLLGRLATIGPDGTPHLRPLGFRLNSDGTIDLGGPWVARTQRYRNVQKNPRVSFIVDDMTPDGPEAIKPGMGRGVEIRGRAETLCVDDPPAHSAPDIIRVHPERVLSWHIDPAEPDGSSRDVASR
ncbi:PPOX class F420-dependent oxidoreductase [Nonomuraea dietziae]|uniref:PPOX class F420-dependent oxidoreductase n=1 Tax=Nonomuraea dietziae TaxID=65515 RepID=UPI0033DF4F9C